MSTDAGVAPATEAGVEVAAAGGVVWRRGDDGVEILLIHRPRYDDWTVPKGKVDPGETWEQAAVREVFEETGVVAVLGPFLHEVRYTDHRGRTKAARYWSMPVAVDTGFEPGDEVDERRWVPPDVAVGLLSYQRDLELLGHF